jgi:hypothetical protein
MVVMGFARKRPGRDGRPRYTAYYLDFRGQERSAGTFSTRKDASDSWKRAEAAVRAGKQGDPTRGRQTFADYVLEKWLPYHLLEPGVRSDYAGQIRRRLLPFFGPMKMREIMPEHVRQWVAEMQAEGASARTIQYCKTSILNAIFTTALSDEVVTIHPSRGVKTPPNPNAALAVVVVGFFYTLASAASWFRHQFSRAAVKVNLEDDEPRGYKMTVPRYRTESKFPQEEVEYPLPSLSLFQRHSEVKPRPSGYGP